MGRVGGLSELAPDSATASGADLKLICPTCGQAWDNPITAFTWRPAERSWWPWLLVVAGLYLVGYFGSGLWGLSPMDVLGQGPATTSLSDKRQAMAAREHAQARRTLEGCAAGVAAALVGLGALARRKRAQADAWHGGTVGTVLAVWRFAETMVLATFRLLLLIVGVAALMPILRGEPPSWGLVNMAIERALTAAIALVNAIT